jgi:hypothetical protein
MLDSWLVGFGIEYSDGGAATKLDDLAKKARTLNPLLEKLAKNAGLAAGAVGDLGKAATSTATATGDLDEMLRKTANSARSAASSVAAAAAGYTAAGDAANYAAASVARFNAVMAAGFSGSIGGGPPRGGFSLPSGDPDFNRSFSRGGNFFGSGPPDDGGGGGGGRGGGPPHWMTPGGMGSMAFHNTMRMGLYGGAAALGLGADAFEQAGKLQQILASIQNVSGANAAQMAGVEKLAFDVGSMTNMSVNQSASMFREIVRQSQGAMPFEAMQSLLPQMAKMQVVLGTTRGMRPEETTDATMSLIHLFRQYNPSKMPGEMDTILRMLELSAAPPSAVVRQMTYFEPVLKNLHVSDNDASALMVAISRFGMARGKGGTSLADLAMGSLGALQLTQHAQSGKAGLLGPKMLNVLDGKGNSRFFTNKGGNIFGFLDQLAAFEQKHGSIEAQKVFKGAFGIQGSRIADVFADKTMIDQLHLIVDAIKNQKSLGLEAQFGKIIGTGLQAGSHAFQNFQSLMTEVGEQSLPGFTKGLNDLGDAFHNAQGWLHQHGEIEQHIQRTITEDVKATEAWISQHPDLLKNLGKDAMFAFDQLGKVGSVLGFIGGKVNDIEMIMHGNAAQKVAAFSDLTMPFDKHGAQGVTYDAASAVRNKFFPPGLPNAGSTAGGFRMPSITVNIDAKGMSHQEATQVVTKGVKDAIEGLMLGSIPQSKRSGDIKTSPKHASQTVTPHT